MTFRNTAPDGQVNLPSRSEAATGRSASKPARGKTRHLSLALQGGGSLGAFAWGVLDRLLEEEDLTFDAISGASAGAGNAIVVAAGLLAGGKPEARRRLDHFWERLSQMAPPRGGCNRIPVRRHGLALGVALPAQPVQPEPPGRASLDGGGFRGAAGQPTRAAADRRDRGV